MVRLIVFVLAMLPSLALGQAQQNPWNNVTTQSGTAYTLSLSDCGGLIKFTGSGAATLTLPGTVWSGCPTWVTESGTGTVAVSGTILDTFPDAPVIIPNATMKMQVDNNVDGVSAQWKIGAWPFNVPTQSLSNSSSLTANTQFVQQAIAAVAPYTLPAATLTTLGGVKGNLSYFAKTASSINVTLGAISVLGVSVLPSVTVAVPGVTAGDFVLASFAGTVPTSITIGGVQATAANTVVITPIATAALVAGSQVVAMNFAFMH